MTMSYRFHYFQNQAALFSPPPLASTWTKHRKMVALQHLVFWPLLSVLLYPTLTISSALYHFKVGSFQKILILIPQKLPSLNKQCQRFPPLDYSHFLSHYPFFSLSHPVVHHIIIWNFLIIYILLYFLFFKLKNHTYEQKLYLNLFKFSSIEWMR